ncbi:MAG: 3-hydroxyacyl-ACP dehydratase FabZ [Bacteroidales bacterium]|nr:3-hydroxyacyl-ACP dehydratase FabZ [Bacteroidales bacterium]
MFDINAIKKVLAHRYPLLMVDRILEVQPHQRAVGLKNLSINEAVFQGHFPEEPILPGVFIIEALAQTGGFIFVNDLENLEHKVKRYIVAVDNVKFIKPVIPGDVMILETNLLIAKGRLSKIKGEARVGAKTVAKAEITYGIAP